MIFDNVMYVTDEARFGSWSADHAPSQAMRGGWVSGSMCVSGNTTTQRPRAADRSAALCAPVAHLDVIRDRYGRR